MNSDWDDAPDYLKQPTRQNAFGRLFVACVLGVGLTCLALYVASVSLHINQPPQQVPEPAVVSVQEKPVESLRIKPVDLSAEERGVWQGVDPGEKRPKQTVFNDSNYLPRQPQNVVNTETMRKSEAYQRKPAEPTRKAVQIERTSLWISRWGGGGSIAAEWKALDNRIDSTSVCANHRRGSIEFRECRKAAKQYFKTACRDWGDQYENSRDDGSYQMRDRYCSAANSFSPMG